MTVHKFMKMWQCIKGNKKCWNILAWIFHFSLWYTHIFDLEDMCLLSNGFKSFGNIFERSFFMVDWSIYHWMEWFLEFVLSQIAFKFLFIFSSLSNCWKELTNFSAVGQATCQKAAKIRKSHRTKTRDLLKGMVRIDCKHILLFLPIQRGKMFNNISQLHSSTHTMLGW